MFEPGLVHPGPVQIAHLPAVLVRRPAGVGRRQVLDQSPQGDEVVVPELGERAPPAVLGGDGVGPDPVAVDVLEEVLAGSDGRIEDPGGRGGGRGRGGRGRAGKRQASRWVSTLSA